MITSHFLLLPWHGYHFPLGQTSPLREALSGPTDPLWVFAWASHSPSDSSSAKLSAITISVHFLYFDVLTEGSLADSGWTVGSRASQFLEVTVSKQLIERCTFPRQTNQSRAQAPSHLLCGLLRLSTTNCPNHPRARYRTARNSPMP